MTDGQGPFISPNELVQKEMAPKTRVYFRLTQNAPNSRGFGWEIGKGLNLERANKMGIWDFCVWEIGLRDIKSFSTCSAQPEANTTVRLRAADGRWGLPKDEEDNSNVQRLWHEKGAGMWSLS